MTGSDTDGVLDIRYAQARSKSRALKYRLRRRGAEVLSAIQRFGPAQITGIIDLGTADGRMLHTLSKEYSEARCVGVEYNKELASFAEETFSDLEICHGDITSLNFPDNSFDVAVAAAVIEHLNEPSRALTEAKRVLKPGGIVVLTAPDPFWDRVASSLGHIEKDQHQHVMDLKALAALVQKSGFTVLNMKKFMLSPIGMPFEIVFEDIFRMLRMDFLMANQLLVARA